MLALLLACAAIADGPHVHCEAVVFVTIERYEMGENWQPFVTRFYRARAYGRDEQRKRYLIAKENINALPKCKPEAWRIKGTLYHPRKWHHRLIQIAQPKGTHD